MIKKIYIYLFNGYADWEIAFLTPEITKNKNFELIYFSADGNPVKSMGGLHVTPSAALSDIDPMAIDLLILPGGEAWEQGLNTEVTDLIHKLAHLEKPIGAVCAATTFLAKLSLLDKIKHTSNDLNYLKAVAPNYQGEKNYQDDLATSDSNIITANGIGPIEFAKEIFLKIGLYDEKTADQWFQLFKNGIWSGPM